MNRFVNCAASPFSNGQLLLGSEKTCLFDCGMAFCAGETIELIRSELGSRPLDYIFASHTHYDHIGALPYFRNEWPGIELWATKLSSEILLKDTPRRVIRELSLSAANMNSVTLPEYSDSAFYADRIFADGGRISLGDLTVQVIETPGHTRDSVSFFVEELGLMLLSETMGVPGSGENEVLCNYLTGCTDSLRSAERCAAYPNKYLATSHTGLIKSDGHVYFENMKRAVETCRDFIMKLYCEGLSPEEIEPLYFERFSTPSIRAIQPEEAFRINAKATIACTIKEFG